MTRRSVGAFLSVAVVSLSAAPTPRVTARIVISTPPTHADAQLQLHASCDGWEHSFDDTCTGACIRTIRVPNRAHCSVEITSKDLWGPRRHFVADSGDVEITVDMVPAGRVKGRLTTPRGVSGPDTLSVAFQSAGGGQSPGPLQTTVTESSSCSVFEDGSFSCTVPAGRLDVKLRAPGFASLYFWRIPIEPGGVKDLGRLTLKPGGSIAGWVTTEDEAADLTATDVVLRNPEPLGGGPEDDGVRGALLTQKQNPDKRGFFQFFGLSPGIYRVRGSQPGFVTVSSPLVELEEGVEAVLRTPMVLARPVEIELLVSPPHDPWDRPWTVALYSRDQLRFSENPEKTVVDEITGTVVIPSVAPGDYWLEVSDSEKNVWDDGELSVHPGMEQVAVQVTIVRVEGVVTLGEQPVAAWLRFSSRGRTVRFRSDDEGSFNGMLPDSGEWDVLAFLEHGQKVEVPNGVEVPSPPSGGASKVEVVLPGLSVAGSVVNNEGDGVAGASVFGEVQRPDHGSAHLNTETTTDNNGRFELVGLPAGRLTAYARKGEASSDATMVTLADGLESAPITLVLREEQHFVGTVIGPAGPLPSAKVMIVPVFPSQIGVARVIPTLSGADGRFEGQVPSWASHVDVAVFAPGYSAAFERFELQPDRELTITVDDRGGLLSVLWAAASSSGPNQRSSQRPRFFYNGMVLIDSFLGSWAKFNARGVWDPAAGEAVIPNLPAGEYSICWPAESRSQPRCSSGSLQPFGELTLDLK